MVVTGNIGGRKARELPACAFPEEVEKTYDRSFEKFAELVNEGRT